MKYPPTAKLTFEVEKMKSEIRMLAWDQFETIQKDLEEVINNAMLEKIDKLDLIAKEVIEDILPGRIKQAIHEWTIVPENHERLRKIIYSQMEEAFEQLEKASRHSENPK